MQVDGSNVQLLFASAQSEYEFFRIETIKWSPDNSRIAIGSRYRQEGDEQIKKGLFLFQLEGKRMIQLVDNMQNAIYWASNGKVLYFNILAAWRDDCRMIELSSGEITKADYQLCHSDHFVPPGTRP